MAFHPSEAEKANDPGPNPGGRTSTLQWQHMRSTNKKQAYYYVYLLLCDDGSYYTGYTNNVPSRLRLHKRGRAARYTKMHRPNTVVHVERFRTRRAAMKRERQVKALSHNQKADLAQAASVASQKLIGSRYRRRMPLRVT